MTESHVETAPDAAETLQVTPATVCRRSVERRPAIATLSRSVRIDPTDRARMIEAGVRRVDVSSNAAPAGARGPTA